MPSNRYDITFETWNSVADDYEQRFMDYDLYNDTFDLFCDAVEKRNPLVFEIGCGPGNITRYVLNKRPDCKIDAIDVAPNMVSIAQKHNPKANFLVMDCRTIDAITKTYDAVLCGFCMPYLSNNDCEKLIRDSYALLNRKGIFYCSFIEDDYSKSGFESSSTSSHAAYVYYHDGQSIANMLISTHFTMLATIGKTYPNLDGSLSIHRILIAKKA